MIPQTAKDSFARTNTVTETTAPETTTETCDVPSDSTSETQQPSANASAPAIEQKGYMEMGADMMKNSLNRALNVGNSVRDSIYGEPPKQKEVNLGESEQPVAGVNELAKLDTSKMTEAQKFDHYKRLGELGGGTMNLDPPSR